MDNLLFDRDSGGSGVKSAARSAIADRLKTIRSEQFHPLARYETARRRIVL
jgi:hypothetical protein